MVRSERYKLYVNTATTGMVHAANMGVRETQGVLDLVQLRYTPDYLALPFAFALDPKQLQLQAGLISLPCDQGVPGVLDDYLPDDWGRRVLTQVAQYQLQQTLNRNSVIDILALLGGSHIGALAIAQGDDLPCFSLGAKLSNILLADEIATCVDNGRTDALSLEQFGFLHIANSSTGVGGARPKALLHDEHGAYLAKFNRNQDPFNNARIELACLRMAKDCGISVGAGRVVDGIQGREVLLLDRFDVDANGHRQHMVTMNALLKEPATQRDAGVVFRYNDIEMLLRKYSVQVEDDMEQLLRQMLFNRAINNTDDHARNFSMVNAGEGYRLSPAYDMVPSVERGQYHNAGFLADPLPPRPSEARTLGSMFGLPAAKVSACAEQIISVVERWSEYAEQTGVADEEIGKIPINV